MLNLSIGFLINPPETKNNSTNPGIDYEIMQMFCNYSIKIACVFRRVDDNDNFGDLIGHLKKGVYDLVLPFLIITEDLLDELTFSTPFHESSFVLVTRQPSATTAFSPLSTLVFDWTVWLCLALTSTVLGLFITVAHNTEEKSLFQTVSDSVDMFCFLSNQTSLRRHLSDIVKPTVIFWGFAALIVMGVYSGGLVTSAIKNAAPQMPFENFETFVDCVEEGRCALVTPAEDHNHPYIRKIFFSNFSSYVRLKQALHRQNAYLELINRTRVYRQILETKNQYLVVIASYHDYMYHTYGNRRCEFASVPLPGEPIGLGMRKNAPFKNAINSFAERLRGSGIKNVLNGKYVPKEAVCQRSKILNEYQAVNPTSFLIYIFVLVRGCLIAFGVFGFELAKYYTKRLIRSSRRCKQLL